MPVLGEKYLSHTQHIATVLQQLKTSALTASQCHTVTQLELPKRSFANLLRGSVIDSDCCSLAASRLGSISQNKWV